MDDDEEPSEVLRDDKSSSSPLLSISKKSKRSRYDSDCELSSDSSDNAMEGQSLSTSVVTSPNESKKSSDSLETGEGSIASQNESNDSPVSFQSESHSETTSDSLEPFDLDCIEAGNAAENAQQSNLPVLRLSDDDIDPISDSGSESSDEELMSLVSSTEITDSDGAHGFSDDEGYDPFLMRRFVNNPEVEHLAQEIINVQKPPHQWSAVREILSREHGVGPRGKPGWGRSNAGNIMFQQRAYGAIKTVEKLELMYRMTEHDGCVNSLNFNREGSRLCSGSDDRQIIIWKWASVKVMKQFDSGHKSNVFQTKFMEFGDNGIHIVSSDRNGEVRYHILAPDGGSPISKILNKHDGAVHRLAINNRNGEPTEFLSAGEDACVYHYDLRDSTPKKLKVVFNNNCKKVQLYSISQHPNSKDEFCVCGRDQFVRVYDRRSLKNIVNQFCPEHLKDNNSSYTNITCATYNWNGTEILASYNDDDIYLYDSKCSETGKFMHRYKGHCNNRTIKGVNYFGQNSEFIMSGSDCGHVYFWEKESESIIQFLHSDDHGIVNVLEAHPRFPMLATSGLDNDVKIWVPSNEKEAAMTNLKKSVQKNIANRLSEKGDFLNDQLFHLYVREYLNIREASRADRTADGTHSSDDTDSSADASANNSDLESFADALPCNPS